MSSTLPSYTPSRPVRANELNAWDIETDVAIVGFGGAGSCAALEAASLGADVHIFELSSAAGGSTALSGGEVYVGGSGGTPIQRKFGFQDSTEDMYRYMLSQNGPQADEAKIRAYAEGAASHFEWLVKQGIPFKESMVSERVVEPLTDDCLLYSGNEKCWPECNIAAPAPRGHAVQSEGMGAGGALLMKHLVERVEQEKVNIHYEARALCLVVSDCGREVVGIMVRENGKVLSVRANGGVILCAGGFVMNEEMLKVYAPRLTRGTDPTGNPGDNGSGIQMGMSVGGAAINMHEGFSSIIFYPPSTLTYGVIVDDKGQRFVNEDAYHGRVGTALLEAHSERFYFVLDVQAYGDYEEFNMLSADVVATGDTIDELERDLDLPKGSLGYTVSTYNDNARLGKDPLYRKQPEWLRPLEPPYVALDVTPGRGVFLPYFTLGGLDTEPTGEVRKSDGQVIPGLYAAGRTACGVPRTGRGYNSGTSIGDATFSGRRAGVSAGERATSAGTC